VKLARQKLTKHYAKVTPTTGMLLIPGHNLDPFRKLQSFRKWDKGRGIVTAARDPGRVTAILYSRLATSLRSLAIILPIYIYTYYHSHPRLQPYSYNYHTYTYEAERRHTCPYTIIAFSVNGYVSLTGLRVDEFYPFSDATPLSQQFRILPSKRYRSIITAKYETLTVPSFN
jgi:hypothetical protein